MSRAPQVFRRSFGHGPRPVLAVHCSLAHSGAWRGVAEAMAEEITLTAFDMLSHGRSPDWDGQGNYQLLNVQAGLALLTGPLDLVGHSFGATVALRMAMARPDLVRSLTLIEPVLFAAARDEDPAAFAALEEASRPAEAAWAAGDRELATRLFNRMWGPGEPKWPDLPAPARAAMVRAMPVVMASRAVLHEDANGTLAPGALDVVTMPVQILTGAGSPPVIPAIARSLCRRLASAAHAEVPGAGHMLPVTRPAETAAQLRRFWTRT
ncbi:alpha/beta hydrolase [Leisingera daeponensis]|uniref:Alpha/beta hydrolase n=1 Tax=Leisingera daeponensis TaxID=405746 RepID=A0ABS7ND21_9RHOB|nr:alpha/beta hydrolase [Leisingera daeponensis]MBY6057740.1 alpha/beta hydrolase [Leisingera daeponensis]MBY6139107.1 alpha/beta hydrolase [Leisingera daeponensis]